MKITEITEGWGEYSNKSNQRMNKFKRNEEVDEGWGEFKSAASRGAQAVGGAIKGAGQAIGRSSVGRALDRGATAVGAKMGSGRAQGKQKMQRAVMGVHKNFQRYLGQADLEPTAASLQTYLKALGIKNPVMNVVREAPEQGTMFGDEPGQAPEPKQPKSANLTKDEIFRILANNITIAMRNGELPKEIQKFLAT